jgi:hypothetical protein
MMMMMINCYGDVIQIYAPTVRLVLISTFTTLSGLNTQSLRWMFLMLLSWFATSSLRVYPMFPYASQQCRLIQFIMFFFT